MALQAPSLVRLTAEIDRLFPNRDLWSEGWLGDNSHATRFSDHNPDGSGWVHAHDYDATLSHTMGPGPVGDFLIAALLRLARSGKSPINYLIYRGRIYSRSVGFRARNYTGSNQHDSHVHVSVLRTSWARAWSGRWLSDPRPKMDVSRIQYAFDGHPKSSPKNVTRVQERLESRGILRKPYIKGRAGRKTRKAMKTFQRRHDMTPDGVPGRPAIKILAGNKYQVVD